MRRSRHVLGYLVIIGCGLVALAAVLPMGRRIEPAPTVPARLGVAGPAVDCLGDELVTRQSGIYVDLYVPGRGGTDENPVTGRRVAGGEVDRGSGDLTVRGTCRSGAALDGQRFRADLDVTDLERRPVEASLELADRALDGTLETAEAPRDATGAKPLSGSELTARTFLAAAAVILLARALGSLAGGLRQPRVVGEIVAGIVLGPSVLGAVAPGVTDRLFPPEVVQVIGALAQFGVIFFMFLVGLELDTRALRSSGRTAVLVSHVSIVAPVVLGALASLALFPLLGDGEFASFALFMGAAMSITAFPVLARILTDTRLDRTPLGSLAITCAAVDDVTAWCLLSVVVAIAQATGAGSAARTAGLALVYVVVMFRVVRPALAWWLGRASSRPGRGPGREPSDGFGNQVLAVLVALVLIGAWCTEEIGIHAIFGAFLVGVVVPKDAAEVAEAKVVEAVTSRLQDVTRLVLLPLFFVVAGLSTRIGLLDSPLLWGLTAGVIVLAVVGKWGGSTLAALACRMPRREAAALGVLMNARGLTEIVILTVGLDLGIISPILFTVMVLMALVTTAMTVPVLTWLGMVPQDDTEEGDTEETESSHNEDENIERAPILSV